MKFCCLGDADIRDHRFWTFEPTTGEQAADMMMEALAARVSGAKTGAVPKPSLHRPGRPSTSRTAEEICFAQASGCRMAKSRVEHA